MRKIDYIITILLMLFVCNCFGKPIVYVVGTGGTIVGKASSDVSSSYTPASQPITNLTAALPELTDIAQIKTAQPFNISSADFTISNWFILAKTLTAILKQKTVVGAVITHGTDTMEETAYFLNLVIKSNKPIVLVGSMRAANSLSPDGPLNLYNAVAVAASKQTKNRGVLVVMNERIYDARNVTKTNTTNVDTFRSPNSGAIGSVLYGKVRFYSKTENLTTTHTVFNISKLNSLPKVAIIYEYLGSSTHFLKTAIKNKTAGIVFAGSGNGSITKSERQMLKQARKNGIIIVRSSRTGSGIVERNSLLNLDSKLGLITANNLNPQKARILLMLALTKTHNIRKIQEYFNKY